MFEQSMVLAGPANRWLIMSSRPHPSYWSRFSVTRPTHLRGPVILPAHAPTRTHHASIAKAGQCLRRRRHPADHIAANGHTKAIHGATTQPKNVANINDTSVTTSYFNDGTSPPGPRYFFSLDLGQSPGKSTLACLEHQLLNLGTKDPGYWTNIPKSRPNRETLSRDGTRQIASAGPNLEALVQQPRAFKRISLPARAVACACRSI